MDTKAVKQSTVERVYGTTQVLFDECSTPLLSEHNEHQTIASGTVNSKSTADSATSNQFSSGLTLCDSETKTTIFQASSDDSSTDQSELVEWCSQRERNEASSSSSQLLCAREPNIVAAAPVPATATFSSSAEHPIVHTMAAVLQPVAVSTAAEIEDTNTLSGKDKDRNTNPALFVSDAKKPDNKNNNIQKKTKKTNKSKKTAAVTLKPVLNPGITLRFPVESTPSHQRTPITLRFQKKKMSSLKQETPESCVESRSAHVGDDPSQLEGAPSSSSSATFQQHSSREDDIRIAQRHRQSRDRRITDDNANQSVDYNRESEEGRSSNGSRQHQARKQSTVWKWLLFLLFTVLVAIAVANHPQTVHSLFAYVAAWRAVPAFTLLPLTPTQPAHSCIYLSKDQIVALAQSDSWTDVRRSLDYHIKRTGAVAMNAFHVGDPRCFTLLRMPDNSTLGMFNLQVVGVNRDDVRYLRELSTACPQDYKYIPCSAQVWAEYLNEESAQSFVQRFDKVQAYGLQAAWHYNLGYSICKDDSDVGAPLTERLIKKQQQQQHDRSNGGISDSSRISTPTAAQKQTNGV